LAKVKHQKPRKPPTPFLERTWVVLAILLIFAPAGIYLMWTQKKYTPTVRVMLSILFSLLFINNVIGLMSLDLEPKAPNKPPAQTESSSPGGEPSAPGEIPDDSEPPESFPELEGYVPPALPAPDFSGSRLLKAHFIDVGQGDCIIVQTPGGQTVLIDGGPRGSGAAVTKYLHDLGVTELMAVVATHPHEDHIGGLISVLESVPVKSVYMPDASHTTAAYQDFIKAVENSGAPVIKAKVGTTIPVDELDMNMIFLAPNSKQYENLNDYSAVLKVSFKSTSFLLTGDAETLSEKEMVDYKRNVKSTVLKVGHHGSRYSSTTEFLEAVKASYAVISCGKDNDYGYPHGQSFRRLMDSGAEIVRTDVMGTLIFETDGDQLGIRKK